MYLIIYKKKLNAEKGRFEFDSPQTFLNANEMLIESVSRYKQTGLSMKVGYKIIETSSGESIFNSTISIDRDIPSLYDVIKHNSNTPRTVTEYVRKVESREIIESIEDFSFNSNHIEEKAKLEQLKAEKNSIQQQLKKEEKERQQRDLDYQKKMKEIQDDKAALEKSIALKEKEAAVKESQQIEALRLLEEETLKAQQIMEEKKELDRKKKEEHEKLLKQVEEEAKKAEIELASIEADLEKQELERKKELQEFEGKKIESTRQVNILQAENDKNNLEHQKELLGFTHSEPEIAVASELSPSPSIVVPKLTIKERLQELDFEEVKRLFLQFLKNSVKTSVRFSKKAYTMFKEYRIKQLAAKEEKKKDAAKKLEIEEKLAFEKIKFMEELKKDHEQQEKEIQRAVKLKEKEMSKQHRIENRYVAAMKKSPVRKQKLGLGSFLLKSVAFLVVIVAIIYVFHLGDKFPILMEIENFVDNFISSISST
ncbi:hypothetical protein ACF09G_37460 [Streptomyces albogriseolus]